jgi:hypothetical protein
MTTQLLRFARAGALACLLFPALAPTASAQNFITPNFLTENPVDVTPYHLATVNTSLIECPIGGTFGAIVYSDFDGVKLYLDYGNGAVTSGPIPVVTTQWGMADVTIADDINAPGDAYVVAVSYKKLVPLSNTYEIHVTRYRVDDVSGAMNVTPMGDLNFGIGDDPKLDVVADHTNIIGNYPAMSRFMLLCTTGGIMRVISAVAIDLSLPMNMFGPPNYRATDVAAVRDITGGNNYEVAYISALSNSNTQLSVVKLNLSTATTTVTPLQSGLSTYNPRIEAFGIQDNFTPFAKWAITTTDNIQKIMLYTSNTLPYHCNPQPFFSGSSQEYPALASGIGPIYGNPSYIGNRQFTYAWGAPAMQRYFSQALDPVGNPISPIDFHIVNNAPCYMLSDPREVIGLSNSSNSGSDMLVAWNEGTHIYYKYMDNTFHYRPTDIDDVKSFATLTVSPNPAGSLVRIRSANDISNISIINSVGSLIYRQDTKKPETTIDVSSFASGTYFLRIEDKTGTVTKPLVIAH